MKVFLVRHAEAQHYTGAPSRRLTRTGEQQAVRVGRFLRESGQFAPGEIWHSGLPRSAETATILQREAAPGARLVARPDVLPEADAASAHDLLMRQEGSVAIVGHHPHLHELFAMLMGSGAVDLWEIVKSGVVCINGHDYYSGLGRRQRRWSIYWMITPALLAPDDPAN